MGINPALPRCRMESNSAANCIHLSDAAARQLAAQAPDVRTQYRGRIAVKGRGEMDTYWLVVPGRELPPPPEDAPVIETAPDLPRLRSSLER